jgi:hypothetical protein
VLVNGQDPTMMPTIRIVGVYAAIGAVACLFSGACWAVQAWKDRRRDREWAAGIARDIRDAGYLRWLEEQFTSEERQP